MIRYNLPLIACVSLVSLFLLVCCYRLATRSQSAVVQLYPHTALSDREQSQIGELQSIKLSVRNELRLLEKERLEVANEIVSKKSHLMRLAQEVKSTQKQLIIDRENLRVISISRQQVSGLDTGPQREEHEYSIPRGANAPIYILGGSALEGATDKVAEARTDCSMSECFDLSACSVLYEPAVFLLQDQVFPQQRICTLLCRIYMILL